MPDPAHDRRVFHPVQPAVRGPSSAGPANDFPNSPQSALAESANKAAASGGSAFDRVRQNLRNRLIGSLAGPAASTGPAALVQKLRKSADSAAMSRGPHQDNTDIRGLTGPQLPPDQAGLKNTLGGQNMSQDQIDALNPH
jgi:hypothetical protein